MRRLIALGVACPWALAVSAPALAADVTINLSDTITVSDSVASGAPTSISLSDTVTVTDTPDGFPPLQISLSDAIAVADGPEGTALQISIADAVNLAETVSTAMAIDTDSDGVADGIEDAGPNGGDSNGDGILDSLQSDVVSVLAGTGEGFLTVEGSPGCSALSQTQSLPEHFAPAADPDFDYPFGLLKLQILCDSVEVRVILHDADPGDVGSFVYRVYGPLVPGDPNTNQWHTFSPASFQVEPIGPLGARVTQRVPLADGQLGDETAFDNLIAHLGGAALAQPAPPAIPTVGRWGFGAALILVLAGGLFILASRDREFLRATKDRERPGQRRASACSATHRWSSSR